MEIYNESVRDLLSTDTSPLRILDDPEVQVEIGSLFLTTYGIGYGYNYFAGHVLS